MATHLATKPVLVSPPSTKEVANSDWLPAKSWTHFVAGGLGGMCGGIVTSPFDVVKTRLQSDMFQHTATAANVRRPGGLLWHFVETSHIIRDIWRYEGGLALFRGLGPTLVGVVPARSINFFTYGNGKQVIANRFFDGKESTSVHLLAAAVAGVTTSTCTNPIWVVKTRLQLSAGQALPFQSSLQCVNQILRTEGVRGFYKGLSASYLGVTEGVIQWTLYEKLKALTAKKGGWVEWAGLLGSAGTAKLTASVVTYPHEVIRTRLRQPPINGVVKYPTLYRTLRIVVAEEGVRALYNGLSAHMLRVVPNAAVMYSIYEGVVRMGSRS